MGYYSDVALTLRKEDAVELVRKAKVECESAYRTLSAAKIVDHDEYVSFLWYSIKWYHFDDVVFITNFCHECDDYSLKRIGEEYSDIDEEMGGEDYDMADCCMIVRDFEISSSKGELTIDKLAQGEHEMTRYEKYQLQWMIDHDYSLDDLIKSISEYGVDCQGDYAMEPELFWQWEKDSGFGGEIWACYAEWLENEGRKEH